MLRVRNNTKYERNPVILVCFYCKEPKNEVAVFGKHSRKIKTHNHAATIRELIGHDIENPRHIILACEPCEACQKQMDKGYTMMAVSTMPVVKGLPVVGKNERGEDLYPYPEYVVMNEKGITSLFDKETCDIIRRDKILGKRSK